MADGQGFDTYPASDNQLSQIRVPLSDAGDAFLHKDASGRTPIIVLPRRVPGARLNILVAGLIVAGVGVLIGVAFNGVVAPIVGALLGVALAAFGLYRSFFVVIPEGTNALLMRMGKYERTIGSGRYWVSPYIGVSHLVTRREIPYDVLVSDVLTSDNVRVSIEVVITFAISDPYRFVYSISASDFDHVFQAACQDALRTMARRLTINDVNGLAQIDLSELRTALSEQIASYGVEITRIAVTNARPPIEFMSALEMRQLAAIQREAQAEQQALAIRRQADEFDLERQRVTARAEIERQRLQQLDERLQAFPQAAEYDWQSAQLEVARALAGNTRAMLQLGRAGDLARALMVAESLPEAEGVNGPRPSDPRAEQ